jgi:hypothetical protein
LEQLGRLASLSSRLSLKVLEATLDGAISGTYRSIGTKGIDALIARGWHVLPSVLYALAKRPEYPAEFTAEEVERMERMRLNMARIVLPILGVARRVASGFPPEVVEEKVTGKWLLEKLKKKHPEVAEAILRHGEEGLKWLEEEAVIIRLYLTGRIGVGSG